VISNSKNSTPKAKTMADLMQSAKPKLVSLRKGEKLQGIITKLTSGEILVDVDAKTEAVVLEKDKRILHTLLDNLHVGDKVTVSVLNPESDTGNTVVSLRRHIEDLLWKELENNQKTQEPMESVVSAVTRGGFLIDTSMGLSGFLPNSQTTISQDGETLPSSQEAVGRKIKVFVLELNRITRKIIFSQKKVLGLKDFEEAIKNLKVGQKISTTVSNNTSFGIFVSIPVSADISIDGLIHVSEISWEEGNKEAYTVGQEVECMIIGIDHQSKRIELSIKRLTDDPFESIAKKISADQKIKGKVTRVSSAGISLELDLPDIESKNLIEGFIRKEKIPPNVSYEVGQEIVSTVSQVDTKRRRVVLVPVLKEKPIGYR